MIASAYVFSSMFFFDAADLQQQGVTQCDGYLNCWYTMLRYCYFDQSGFNFMWDLYPAHRLMFYGSILYLMVAALGILFGILAIFGAPFEVLEEVVESTIQAEERDLLNQLDNALLLLKSRSKALEELENLVQARRKLKRDRKLAPTRDTQDDDGDPGSGGTRNSFSHSDPSNGSDTMGNNELHGEGHGSVKTGLSPDTDIHIPLDLKETPSYTLGTHANAEAAVDGADDLPMTPEQLNPMTDDPPIDRDESSPYAEIKTRISESGEGSPKDMLLNASTDPPTVPAVAQSSHEGGPDYEPPPHSDSTNTADRSPNGFDDS